MISDAHVKCHGLAKQLLGWNSKRNTLPGVLISNWDVESVKKFKTTLPNLMKFSNWQLLYPYILNWEHSKLITSNFRSFYIKLTWQNKYIIWKLQKIQAWNNSKVQVRTHLTINSAIPSFLKSSWKS